MARSPRVRELQDHLAPVTLAGEHLLAVPGPLQPLFPLGGLQRGWSVGFSGPGGWSVALAMAGAATGDDGWMAVAGVEELGLVAAAELGVRLDRLLLVESTGAAMLATVVASLIEVADVIALSPRRPVGHRDARRLAARARERGAVLFHLDGGRSWPEALDVAITAETEHWEGIGPGHGNLLARTLGVEARGRRSSARRRHVSVLLPDADGKLAPIPPSPSTRRPSAQEADPQPLFARVS